MYRRRAYKVHAMYERCTDKLERYIYSCSVYRGGYAAMEIQKCMNNIRLHDRSSHTFVKLD